MLCSLYTLVDGRTECKPAGGTAGKPIKDVMGYAETAKRTSAKIQRPGRKTAAGTPRPSQGAKTGSGR